jgi:hypothetical protein
MVLNLSVCMVVSGMSSTHDLRCQTVLSALSHSEDQQFLFGMIFWFHSLCLYIYVGEPHLMSRKLLS